MDERALEAEDFLHTYDNMRRSFANEYPDSLKYYTLRQGSRNEPASFEEAFQDCIDIYTLCCYHSQVIKPTIIDNPLELPDGYNPNQFVGMIGQKTRGGENKTKLRADERDIFSEVVATSKQEQQHICEAASFIINIQKASLEAGDEYRPIIKATKDHQPPLIYLNLHAVDLLMRGTGKLLDILTNNPDQRIGAIREQYDTGTLKIDDESLLGRRLAVMGARRMLLQLIELGGQDRPVLMDPQYRVKNVLYHLIPEFGPEIEAAIDSGRPPHPALKSMARTLYESLQDELGEHGIDAAYVKLERLDEINRDPRFRQMTDAVAYLNEHRQKHRDKNWLTIPLGNYAPEGFADVMAVLAEVKDRPQFDADRTALFVSQSAADRIIKNWGRLCKQLRESDKPQLPELVNRSQTLGERPTRRVGEVTRVKQPALDSEVPAFAPIITLLAAIPSISKSSKEGPIEITWRPSEPAIKMTIQDEPLRNATAELLAKILSTREHMIKGSTIEITGEHKIRQLNKFWEVMNSTVADGREALHQGNPEDAQVYGELAIQEIIKKGAEQALGRFCEAHTAAKQKSR